MTSGVAIRLCAAPRKFRLPWEEFYRSGRFVELPEVVEELAELVEALGAKALGPGVLDFGDRLADRGCGFGSAGGQDDPFRALVIRVGPALEIAEALELAEEMVERLFAHAESDGEVRG